jgi:hypothetical protein
VLSSSNAIVTVNLLTFFQDSQPVWQSIFLAVPTYLGFLITVVLYTHIVIVIVRSTNTMNKIDKGSSAAKSNTMKFLDEC